jgi:hypothetical protein
MLCCFWDLCSQQNVGVVVLVFVNIVICQRGSIEVNESDIRAI